jgi:hypothetical protein
MVLEAGTPLHVRRFELLAGGTRYGVSPLTNPASIIFRPGGRFGEDCIIQGEVSTIQPAAASLFRAFRYRIQKHFTRVGISWLGPEARALFEAGARLTPDARNRMFDLRPEPKPLPPPRE